MDGKIFRGVYKTVDRPKGKTIIGIRLIIKRKIGKDGHVEEYKYRCIAQGLRQIKGLHYPESSSPRPTQPSVRMALELMVSADQIGRQLDI